MKSRVQKHKEGEERNAEWRALSKDEQISSLLKRIGKCKRQLEKLHHAR